MFRRPAIQLARLRDIGWAQWDPLCLGERGPFDQGDGGPNVEEYDKHLLEVVAKLRRGEPPETAITYLQNVDSGLYGAPLSTTRGRAENTVAAIADYLSSLPAGRLAVR